MKHMPRNLKVHFLNGNVQNRLVGPFLIDGYFTGAKYLDLLKTHFGYSNIISRFNKIEGLCAIIDGLGMFWMRIFQIYVLDVKDSLV